MRDLLSNLTIRDVLQFLTFFGVLLGFIHNKLMTDKIANNHLHHIDEKLNKIDSDLQNLNLEVNKLNTDVAVLNEKTKSL